MSEKVHKSGFTLIELLIVTVVIVTLMAVVFRLSGVAGDANEVRATVERMQKLENCLSGYYAVFGSYPPVPLQGASRNIYRKVADSNSYIQSSDADDLETELISDNVLAACRAQPVAAMYPPPAKFGDLSSEDKYKQYWDKVNAYLSAGYWDGDEEERVQQNSSKTQIDLATNPGYLNSYQGESDSTKLQLFRYGLMSFLLPRYRMMLQCAQTQGSSYGGNSSWANMIDNFRQWTEFNQLPAKMDSGISYSSWKDFCNDMGGDDDWEIDLIPSQAACARWLPNLVGNIVSGRGGKFFGMDIGDCSVDGGIPSVESAPNFAFYSPGGVSASDSSGYPLMSTTVRDGWGMDFFYYSPPPYQSYVLWSAGPNKKTFPPWVDLDEFRNQNQDHYHSAMTWMADDVKFMSTGK